MSLLGQPLESSLGWETCPPSVIVLPCGKKKGKKKKGKGSAEWFNLKVNLSVGYDYLRERAEQTVTKTGFMLIWKGYW